MDKIIDQIMQMGHDRKTAEEIIDTFRRCGGLSCYMRWPEEFSFLSNRRNVLDILIENKFFIKSDTSEQSGK